MNQEIYQDIILSHYRDPQRKIALSDVDDSCHIRNPNCGDIIKLDLRISDDGIVEIEHDAQGCAASVASCSIMCESLSGQSLDLVIATLRKFLADLDKDPSVSYENESSIEFEALQFFRNAPARKLCVSLAWRCLENALAAKNVYDKDHIH